SCRLGPWWSDRSVAERGFPSCDYLVEELQDPSSEEQCALPLWDDVFWVHLPDCRSCCPVTHLPSCGCKISQKVDDRKTCQKIDGHRTCRVIDGCRTCRMADGRKTCRETACRMVCCCACRKNDILLDLVSAQCHR